MSNRKPIPVGNLKLEGKKLVVKPKRYDKCTELKRKHSTKPRVVSRGKALSKVTARGC